MGDKSPQNLELLSLIGFSGGTLNGMVMHPDGVHVVYGLGNTVLAYHWTTAKQRFYRGHDSVVSTIAVSRSGKYVGAGYATSMAYVWDFVTGNVITAYNAHLNRVESVAFSCCESYLMTLGGTNDGSVAVYDIGRDTTLSADPSVSPAVNGSTMLRTLNAHREHFVVVGENIMRLWTLGNSRALHQVDASMVKIRRVMLCVEIDRADEYAYCGTTTGDILKLKLHIASDTSAAEDRASWSPPRAPTLIECFGKYPAAGKRRAGSVVLYTKGVTSLLLIADGTTMVVGTGDGLVELTTQQPQPAPPPMDKRRARQPLPQPDGPRLFTPTRPLLVTVRSVNVRSRVTSLQLMGDAVLLVGTADCELFTVRYRDFSAVRVFTCHTSVVRDMAFPRDFSRVFATASWQDVRVWSADTLQELLRVTVRKCTCTGVVFAPDGSQIVTSWCDGRVRAFTPQTGRPLYTINNCHNHGVSSVAMHPDGRRLLTGGGDGRVCVWLIDLGVGSLAAVLKDHHGMVSAIDVHRHGRRAVSSSADGTCVIWDMDRYVRLAAMFTKSVLADVKFHPNDLEIVMCGTNGYVGYWDASDGTAISSIETPSGSTLTSLDITPAGNYFVTSNTDKMVEVWLYKEGRATHVGLEHTGSMTNVRVSPDCTFVVSTSVDGAILLWRFPFGSEAEPPSDRDSVISGHAGSGSREQQTDRSRQLSQKKTSARKENINHISSAQKVRVDANSTATGTAATGGGKAVTTGAGGSNSRGTGGGGSNSRGAGGASWASKSSAR